MRHDNELIKAAELNEALGVTLPPSPAEQEAINAYHNARHWDAYLQREIGFRRDRHLIPALLKRLPEITRRTRAVIDLDRIRAAGF
jgi:hypothetical protein